VGGRWAYVVRIKSFRNIFFFFYYCYYYYYYYYYYIYFFVLGRYMIKGDLFVRFFGFVVWVMGVDEFC
jgi:hypothetical protein